MRRLPTSRWLYFRCHTGWPLIALVILFGQASASAAPAPHVYRDHVEPHWFADETRFWYCNELSEKRREFVVVDAEAGTRTPAFDHARVAANLAALTGKDISPDRLPIDELDFQHDGAVILVGDSGAWRLDLQSYELVVDPARSIALPRLPPLLQIKPSREGGSNTSITVVNRTPGTGEVYWIDPQGQRHQYATVNPGERWRQRTFAGHVWLVTDRVGGILGVFRASPDPAAAVVGLTPEPDQPAADPDPPAKRRRTTDRPRASHGKRSPNGRWSLELRDDNLFLKSNDDREAQPLSHDGKPGDGYSLDHVWWSPDSREAVALRTEAGQEHKIFTVESSPQDQVQPNLRTMDYLKPGDRIDHPRPQLFHVANREQVAINQDLIPNPWSIDDVRWSLDSSRFTFVYNQRGHQVLRVIAVDAATGIARSLVDEHNDTFIDYSGKYFCRWIGDDELIWMSERNGWNHLWRYDAKSGRVINQITQGEWVVQEVTQVDESRRQITFKAGGVRTGQDPYYTHLCRINFDGTGLAILTEADGTHTVRWSPEKRYFLDTWSRVDSPPVTELRRGEDGRLICTLEHADSDEVLSARGGHWPQRFVAKGRDGVTDIYGIILLPRNFDPTKSYPVVENIYAGPQDFSTPKAFRSSYGNRQSIADMGMVVVQCDGMGTSGRSKHFHDVCWKNLKDAGFPDRIAWIKAAAAAHPQMDLSRVGIYGGSAGGQNAMAALLWHHDFYKVAVADCGCHDNRMDKIWWNEQWMGWPVGPQYAACSNVDNAGLLEGKLMLIFGEMHDNVDPASTMQVVNALEKANKDFELVVVTGAHHGAAETPYGSHRRSQFLKQQLSNEELH